MRLCLLISLLLFPLAVLAGESLDYTDTLHFTWARIPLGKLTLNMKQEGAHYSMRADAKTQGIALLFNRHISTTTVEGLITKEFRYLPQHFRSDYHDNDEKKLIAVEYDAQGMPIKETIEPPREEIRPLVPQEMKQKSVDILTGFFVMRQKLKQALESNQSHFSVTIYDGKRLFHVDAAIEAPAAVVHFHGTSRSAIKLVLQRVALAGYKEKELKKLKKHNPPVALYVEPERLVPFGLSLKVYGGKLEAWVKPNTNPTSTK